MKFRKNNSAPDQSFQIAPMIDVIFLLLAFFVASQIFSQWETEIDITLPTARSSEQPDRIPGEMDRPSTICSAVLWTSLPTGRS